MTLESPERIQAMWEETQANLRERRYPKDFPALPAFPAARYYGEEFHELENRYLWPRTWLFVGLENEFGEPGAYRTYRIGGIPVLIVRGNDNTLRAFYNTCQHRGAMLKKDTEGKEQKLRCQYHCWTYDLEGKLTYIPDEHYFAGMDKSKHGLKQIRCETLGSLIFVNLDSEAEPLHEYMTDMPSLWADVPLDDLRLLTRFDFEVDCNWKCLQDNFAENYHARFVHPNTINQVIDSNTSGLRCIRGGHSAIYIRARKTLTSGMGAAFYGSSPEDSSEQSDAKLAEISRSAQRSYNVFPNGTFVVAENLFPIVTVWPLSVGRTKVEVSFVMTGQIERDAKLEEDTLTFFKSFIGEDLEAMSGMHTALASGGVDSISVCWPEQFIYHHEQQIDQVIGRDNIPEELQMPKVDLPIA